MKTSTMKANRKKKQFHRANEEEKKTPKMFINNWEELLFEIVCIIAARE